jgi:pyrimidine 5'-nucleotidase
MDALTFAATVAYHLLSSSSRDEQLRRKLRDGTSLNANELIERVTEDNQVIPGGVLRSQMRLGNLWHRATYVLLRHEPTHLAQHGSDPTDVYVLVQKRSEIKDYCPGKLDPAPGGVVGCNESYLENVMREMEEEMGVTFVAPDLARLFTFPYEDGHVRVWGEFFEGVYRGALKDLVVQKEEVETVYRLSLSDLKDLVNDEPEKFMPDACHAIKLYLQRKIDINVNRRLLKGYTSSDLDAYSLRPKPEVIFFDCDDCLYFDGWTVANKLTSKINQWCVNHGLKHGHSYELYKQYGTALKGLLAEGYLEDTDEATDAFLREVHDLPIAAMIPRDEQLRKILTAMDPSIPKYIFTASVREHAERCIKALGIDDLFVDIIDTKRCDLETKHSRHAFEVAMKVAGVSEPGDCLFFDDSAKNIRTARDIGWRAVLVGRVARDSGKEISSEHAELEIDRIHDMAKVLPELFETNNISS